MSAVRLWVRSDLRRRWRAWVVLGLLAGITMGLAIAGVAGARRTSEVLPRFSAAAPFPAVGVLANDPRFTAEHRAAVAKLPEVRGVYPFVVWFAGSMVDPPGLGEGGGLIPTTPNGTAVMAGVVIDGRLPTGADEVLIDENAKRELHLKIGSTLVAKQDAPAKQVAELPPGLAPRQGDLSFTARLRVVGITKSVDKGVNWNIGSAFYAAHRRELIGPTNIFANLRYGTKTCVITCPPAVIEHFQRDVQKITGLPINVENFLDGFKKTNDSMRLERDGLLLFALAVLIGGGALVGQALVRSVTGGVGDLATWRAIGAERRVLVRALVLPTVVPALVGAATAGVTAVALSPRFPIGLARNYELDLGVHADWLVIALGAVVLVGAVFTTAVLAAQWRVVRGERAVTRPSVVGGWALRTGLAPALAVGSRLAVEPGKGRRAVPVRSALSGAIVGVLGIVACFTFRAGIDDAQANPQRSGIVWDYELVNSLGSFPPADVAKAAHDPAVSDAIEGQWVRNVLVNGNATPTFGTNALAGDIELVVLAGRAPRGPDEIAFAPSTMKARGVAIGDTVKVGSKPARDATVVGEALMPATSHTEYDQSAWMTLPGLRASLPPVAERGADDLWDFVFVRWKPGTNVAVAQKRLQVFTAKCDCGGFVPELPSSVADLGRLRSLPFALGIFFALLAIATVAHALVTTVRRWRRDLAVLRSIGFTRGQSRVAIAWQSTLLATAGVIIGVPLGIASGRLIWRWLADSFPFVYAPPLAVVVVVLIVPVAIAVANALAAGPAATAARIRPAEVLRAE